MRWRTAVHHPLFDAQRSAVHCSIRHLRATGLPYGTEHTRALTRSVVVIPLEVKAQERYVMVLGH